MINLSCDYCEAKITGTPDDFHKLTVFDEVSLNGKRVVVHYSVTASCGHICLGCAKKAVAMSIGLGGAAKITMKTPKKKKPQRAKTIDELV